MVGSWIFVGSSGPFVVVAVFEDRMNVDPAYTHTGRGWNAVTGKPDREQAAFLMHSRESTPGQTDNEVTKPTCSISKQLSWKKTSQFFNDHESVVYADTLSTVLRGAEPKPEKVGKMDESSIMKLIAGVAALQVKGSRLGPSSASSALRLSRSYAEPNTSTDIPQSLPQNFLRSVQTPPAPPQDTASKALVTTQPA